MVSEDIEKFGKLPEQKKLKAGLYLVATPIGNLGDISLRALEALRSADIVLCEDTRMTRKLLSAYQIRAKLQSYNDHSDESRRDYVLEMLADDKCVVLVSDAGMPLISDPGYKLVVACEEAEHYVTTVPGANAPLSALQLSGLPSDQFCFLGFLPNKSKARQDFLHRWECVPATLIAFETAPRLVKSLSDIQDVFGGRVVAVVREITKFYEEVRKGVPSELISYYEENGLPKGEIVLVIEPPLIKELNDDQISKMIRDALKTMKTKEAAGLVAKETGRKKNDLYNIALEIAKEDLGDA